MIVKFKKIVLHRNLKCLKTGVFSFCYQPDDAEIILNEGLDMIEIGVFSLGELNLLFEEILKICNTQYFGEFFDWLGTN